MEMKTKTIIFLIILLFSKLYAENQKSSFHFDGKEGEVINAISDGIITDLGFDEERGMFVTVNYEELRELFILDPRVNPSHTFVYRDKPYWDSHCLNKDVSHVAYHEDAEFLINMCKFNEKRKK